MTCITTRPSADDLFTRYRQMFETTVLGGATIVPESNEWYAVAVNYAMAEEFYAISEQDQKELNPETACDDNLIAMAARDGVYPRAAIPAQGYLKLTGTAGTALPSPLDFTVDGQAFVTANTATQPTAIDDAGEAVIRAVAVNPGDVGNVVSATGTLDTAVAGVNTAVEVCGGNFCSGEEAETTTAFRTRYLNRLKYQPRATVAWIIEKLQEWPCATRALLREGSCCGCGCEDVTVTTGSTAGDCADCGCVECGGKMNFYVMFDNSFDNGIAPETTLYEIEEWMFGSPQGYGMGQVEMGVCGKIVPVTGVPVNVTVDINDCPTTTDLNNVTTVVNEFFTTVEPSKPLNANQLEASISRILGGTIDVAVTVELENASDGYGQIYGAADADSKVYATGCALEPDCDYMLTLNNLQILRNAGTTGLCS